MDSTKVSNVRCRFPPSYHPARCLAGRLIHSFTCDNSQHVKSARTKKTHMQKRHATCDANIKDFQFRHVRRLSSADLSVRRASGSSDRWTSVLFKAERAERSARTTTHTRRWWRQLLTMSVLQASRKQPAANTRPSCRGTTAAPRTAAWQDMRRDDAHRHRLASARSADWPSSVGPQAPATDGQASFSSTRGPLDHRGGGGLRPEAAADSVRSRRVTGAVLQHASRRRP